PPPASPRLSRTSSHPPAPPPQPRPSAPPPLPSPPSHDTTPTPPPSLHAALPISIQNSEGWLWESAEMPETVRQFLPATYRGLCVDRKSTRLNSSHVSKSYAVFCLKKKNEGRRRKGKLGSGQIEGHGVTGR